MSIRARTSQSQGFYYVAASLWAIFDMRGYAWVTGPKTDVWLVRAMALVLLANGVSLIIAAVGRGRRAVSASSQFLGMATAAGLFGIDCYYVLADVISPIYLFDAALEAAFLIAWLIPPRRQFPVGILRRAAPHWRQESEKG